MVAKRDSNCRATIATSIRWVMKKKAMTPTYRASGGKAATANCTP